MDRVNGYGIVLGGGGAKGAYEIGVWKALRELNIPVEIVVGTSVGALNGALIVQGEYEKAVELWCDLKMSSIISFDECVEKNESKRSSFTASIKTIKKSIIEGGMDITPLKVLLKNVIDEEKIRSSEIDFGIVTFSLTDFKPVKLFKKDIPKGMLIDYLLASSCFPTFKPYFIDKKRYIDGGVYDNIPISMILESYHNIIAVDVSGPGRTRKADTNEHNFINIRNSEDLGGTLKFDGEASKINIEYGYFDTLRAFNRLKGKRYYFVDSFDENWIYRQYVEDEEINNFYRFFNAEFDHPKLSKLRMIEYKILRLIRQYSETKLNRENVFKGMLEICAEAVGINRRRMYTSKELIEEILKEYESYVEYWIDKKGKLPYIQALSKNRISAFYNATIRDNTQEVISRRVALGLTQPKIMIAAMFIQMIMDRLASKEPEE